MFPQGTDAAWDEVYDVWFGLGGLMLAVVAAKDEPTKLHLPENSTGANIASASETITAHTQASCGLSIG